MRARLLFTVLALTAAPVIAMAECSGFGHDVVTMSCPDGHTFDTNTKTCLPSVTG